MKTNNHTIKPTAFVIKPTAFVTKSKWAVYFLLYIACITFCFGLVANHLSSQWMINSASFELKKASAAMHGIREARADYSELEKTNEELLSELAAIKSKNPDPKREEIEAYVRKIFTKDNPNLALAISHHECGYTNKNYPKCSLKSSVENSIGLFQINLHNAHKNIHADRIPGVTMAEKIQWLENPFNNTLYAYWVFKTSGWNPWSAYTNGAYLNDPLVK